MKERRTNLEKRQRFNDLRAELLERLRAVCAEMSPHELARLTDRMVRVRLKYEPWSSVPDR